jgi:hypothetical protein
MRGKMNPESSLSFSVKPFPIAATVIALIVLMLGPAHGFAQQGLPPGSQNDSGYGQYAPPPQQYGQQQGYPPQSNYGQQGQQAYSDQPDAADDYGQAPAPVQTANPLSTEQLEQLVAPIALYPDTLVAQVLAAATYPDQVVDADHWRQAQGNAGPDQIAGGANAQSWDPSLKALTAFPQVLAEMDQNIRWTIALGNAYYNQPQDVLDVIQVMRQRAQAAGNLQSTPQESMSYDQGYIQLAPVNPQVVYLPTYDPWTVYGDPVQPYRGFSLAGAFGSFFNSGIGSSAIQYGLSFAMGAFSRTPFGWLGWGLDWLGHSLLFHNSDYYSHSRTVSDWGLPHGGPRAPFNRGGLNARGGGGYRQGGYGRDGYARAGAESNRYGGYNGNRGYGEHGYGEHGYSEHGYGSAREQAFANSGRYAENRPGQGGLSGGLHGYPQGGYARPQMQAYNHPQAPVARPQQGNQGNRAYGGAPSYGSGFSAGNRGYEGRPGGYGSPSQGFRAPSGGHDGFGERGFEQSRGLGGSSGGRGFGGYSGKPEKSGGSHMFGGGHEAKAPKMSKGFGGGGHAEHGGHGGGGHSGGHSGGHGGGHHH